MASPKHVDDPETCVDEMLAGLQAAFPQLRSVPGARAVVLSGLARTSATVGLMSGGGAGHEPFCAGYVGEGMLSGAVSGAVFASPPATHIVKTLKCVAQQHSGGVLLVVPNYTGDCLNFGLAAEWAKKDGIQVERVVVADDCALLQSHKETTTGRRGMCGLVFVFKIVGHLASTGATLEYLSCTAKKIVESMATMGFASKSCTLPGAEAPLVSVECGDVELGLGVHGEAGVCTVKMSSPSKLTVEILRPIIETLKLKNGNKVAVLINNLGGLSQLELWIFVGTVRKQLESKGIEAIRIYAGHLMTSLETAGVQVCILNLCSEQSCCEEWLRCLDACTSAPAWPGSALSITTTSFHPSSFTGSLDDSCIRNEAFGPELRSPGNEILRRALFTASQAIIANMDKLNELDSGCGDGDCGSTLARLAKGILQNLPDFNLEHPAQLLLELADLASTSMGGTSGAIYGLLFSGASGELCNADGNELWLGLLHSWKVGLQTVMNYSEARKGDRTMLDALLPACEEFERVLQECQDGISALRAAVDAAKLGCDNTASMSARAGRASYVNDSYLCSVDAGAYGVFVWLNSLHSALAEP